MDLDKNMIGRWVYLFKSGNVKSTGEQMQETSGDRAEDAFGRRSSGWRDMKRDVGWLADPVDGDDLGRMTVSFERQANLDGAADPDQAERVVPDGVRQKFSICRSRNPDVSLANLFGRTTLQRESQPKNASSPMLLAKFGIVTLRREVHPANAHRPIFATESGIETLRREVQLKNVHHPIFVTDSGIEMLSREVHPENAWSPMVFTDFGIVTLRREEQLRNAPMSMLSTDSGIETLRREQPKNATSPIHLADFGIVTLSREVQLENA